MHNAVVPWKNVHRMLKLDVSTASEVAITYLDMAIAQKTTTTTFSILYKTQFILLGNYCNGMQTKSSAMLIYYLENF